MEVMVSVAVIAIVFVSVFRIQSASVNLANASRFSTIAPMLARTVLADIEQDPGEWNETEGEFGENYPGYSWKVEITDTAFETDEIIKQENQGRLKKITIEIIESSEGESYQVNTWRLVSE